MPYDSDRQRRFMHTETGRKKAPGLAERYDQEIRDARKRKGRTVAKSARYGSGGGVGRRIQDDDLVEKGLGDIARRGASNAKFLAGAARTGYQEGHAARSAAGFERGLGGLKQGFRAGKAGQGKQFNQARREANAVARARARRKVLGGQLSPVESFREASQLNRARTKRAFSQIDLRVGKAADWKTIEQREMQAGRGRRTKRRGAWAVGLGATTAVGAHAASEGRSSRELKTVGSHMRGAYKFSREAAGLSNARSARNALQLGGTGLRVMSPHGKLAAGGLGLATIGGAGMAQGRSREAYHQHHINVRRRANAKKVNKALVSPAFQRRLANIVNRGARSGSLGSGIPNRGVAEPRRLSSVGRHRSGRTDATPAYAARLRRNARQGTIGQGEYVGRRRKVTKGFVRQSVARPIARRSPRAVIGGRGSTGGQLVATGGAGVRKGRRWTDPRKVSTVVKPLRRATVGKARYFDPDESRARRQGIATGALGLLGGAALVRGGRGAVHTTRTTQMISSTGLKNLKTMGKSKAEQKAYADLMRQRATRYASQGINVGRKDLAYLGGGTTGVLGAAELHHRGSTRRGGRWT